MDWTKDSKYTNVWTTHKDFNSYQYNVIIIPEVNRKTVRYWIHISSGKKRKDFEIFEDKENKSLGGIRALYWIREAMYDFPKYFSNRVGERTQYICIGWADSRRRDIYQRLEKEGFQFMNLESRKILIKKL